MKLVLNSAQKTCLAVFSVFAVIGFGPISPGCLIGMYVALKRPLWFKTLLERMYADIKPPPSFINAESGPRTRKKCFLSLLGLFILDIAPVPVTPVVAFAIIFSRPLWFYRAASGIYRPD